MAQDIRDMFRDEDPGAQDKLNTGHKERFEQKLDRALPKEKKTNTFFFLKIAAVLIVALGVGLFYFSNRNVSVPDTQIVETPDEESIDEIYNESQFQLSDISPEFKKIESYYLAGINMELAKLEINNDNKALIDAFMLQMEELDKEYQRLNAELQEIGPNEQTIEAMIANLQLRMDLLRKLKSKLNEIKQSKNKSYENLQA
ncbi:MAG TPA: hypothetical protein VLN46_03985 [Gillisia sp.]|nr:hypothetical protein [Gillisia sp.]